MNSSQWSVLELLNWTTQFFDKKNIESPRLQAELLLAHVLKWKRIDLYTRFDYVVPPDKLAEFKQLILQRAERVPIQYILGTCEFRSLEFKVTPAVLIPRPETELAVDALFARAKDKPGATVLDVGTGSGCIAVAAAKALPAAEFWAVDFSADALQVAAENAKRHGVDSRVHFIRGDLFEPVSGQTFDFIVSNPPYVSEAEWPGLMPEVRDHEPHQALLAGPDGLDAYRRIIPAGKAHLAAGGKMILEMGAGQAGRIRQIAAESGLHVDDVIPDFARIERVIVISCADSPAERKETAVA